MEVSKIRPKEDYKNSENEFTKEVKKFFVDETTKKNLISIKCPSCESTSSKKLMKKNGFNLQICNSCGMQYVNPRPNEKSILNYFEKSESVKDYSKMVELTKKARKQKIINSLSTEISNIVNSKENLQVLEIGCGVGLLLEELVEKNPNWTISGLEQNKYTADFAKSKGLNVINGNIENLPSQNKFDLVYMWAVYDHFSDPLNISKKLFELLNKDGYLIIGNMNTDGFDAKIMGLDNPAYTIPARLNFFGLNTFRSMLLRSGFKDIKISTNGKLDTSIVSDYWHEGGKNGKNDFLSKIIENRELSEKFQKFLIANNLSSHMIIIART
tara:strand:+ start:1983 stop:2963 length:981 start_codon:yes stop_codon:yes gene_type:complete